MISLTMLLFEGIWFLGEWIRKVVELFQCCAMSHSSGSMEYSGSEYDLINCGNQEIPKEKNISMWPIDCSCDNLVKKMADFCPCPKSLPEAKV